MSKQTKCWECWGLNGHHWPACQSRGYSAVGPHPSAPPREAPSPARDPSAPLEMCCGGTTVRAVCTFHGPSAATERAPAYEVGDETVDAVRREPTSCGQYMRTYRGGLLVEEEPIDCYVGAGGYATSQRVAVALDTHLAVRQLQAQGLISQGVFDVDVSPSGDVTVTMHGRIHTVRIEGVLQV